jgi:UDP-N-acetylmuramyl pentapeptide phosphotransferase/UDP-N-acetylglucosamine-1-phosphate transferase
LLVPISYLGIELFRRESLRRGWFDIPNERSQHREPVPRGGGIIIAAVGLISYVTISILTATPLSWGYLLGSIIVVGISWADDLYSLGFTVRFLVHVLAAVIIVVSEGYWTSVGLPGSAPLQLGLAGAAVTTIWIVWTINAYNFMDGIDGMAGLQAVIASAAWATLAWLSGASGLTYYSAAIAAVSVGFLIHNWSPARIFMGDVGSAFLGFTFASMPLLFATGSGYDPALPVIAALFLWPFMFDSGITRLRRALRGIRFWEPNREHYYQKLVESGLRVPAVAFGYGVLSLLISGFAIIFFQQYSNAAMFYIVGVLLATVLLVLAARARIRNAADR